MLFVSANQHDIKPYINSSGNPSLLMDFKTALYWQGVNPDAGIFMRQSQFVLLILVGGTIVAVSMGIRQSFGVFLQPVVNDLELTRTTFGLTIAIQNLIWGLAQPFAGVVTDKYGSYRMLILSSLLYIAGLALTAHTTTATGLHLSLGMLVGLAMSGTTFTVVLSAIGRLVPPEKRSLAFGIVSAGGSFGMFSFVPLSQLFIGLYGWSVAFLILAGCVMIVPLLTLVFQRQTGAQADSENLPGETLTQALRCAGAHSGYWLLNCGFLVCGFHVAFIATHLPAFLQDSAIAPMHAAFALGLIGVFNILGTYLAGLYGGRYRKKYLLSGLYLGRALVIAVFIALPLTELTLGLFAAAMGLLWLGTIPLTSGLVAQIFGVRYGGTLFGIVFFSHQIGSFLGAWLGGYLFETTGSYSLMWQLAVLLGLVAALLHWPIRDEPVTVQTAPA